MAMALFNVFFNIIKSIINVVLTPINSIVANFFPNLTTIINSFNSALKIYLGGGLSYFFNLIPPTSRTLILLYLSILLAYYTGIFAYHLILSINITPFSRGVVKKCARKLAPIFQRLPNFYFFDYLEYF